MKFIYQGHSVKVSVTGAKQFCVLFVDGLCLIEKAVLLLATDHCIHQHCQCHCFHLSVCCVYAGSSMEFETEDNSTDKSQPFEIKTEDITEHDDKPALYLCPVCGKFFMWNGHLDVHTRIHDLMYSCSECEESFSSQRALS